ncbi:MAG: acyl-CoA synthetase [Hyphomicrobiaceae bacterium]
MASNAYEQFLDKNPANYQPLSPISIVARAAAVHPDHIAVVHGAARTTYADYFARSRRLASALAQRYIGKGDTVSVMLSNTPPMLEAHVGVPMTGAVLHALNTRLDAVIIAFQLDHANSKVLIVDREFAPVIREALEIAKVKPLLIDYDDPEFPQTNERISYLDYEEFVQSGDPAFKWRTPDDEWEAISLNYTSGTTGNPKGVVYHHRGAALMCYANTIATGMGQHPVYLWTLPMFHCNGWCFPWSVATVAGTHVCLRWVRAKAIYDAIADHRVSHLCGAPIVMATLLNAADEDKRAFDHTVAFSHAAAPPPEAVLVRMQAAGFKLTHLYGLTETYGPAVLNEWKSAWDDLAPDAWGAKRARQGVRYTALDDLAVMDPVTMRPVPADGETMGEVMFRGNIVMKGYLKNPKATDEAFRGGWFHSGDLGVLHPDGYIQLKDRSKDIIISGGENISSIEVEDALYRHSAIAHCAVVAKPDEKWGETPCAFIELKPGAAATSDEIIAHCQTLLARYKVPRHVVFCEVPKTSTGKIQKFRLRDLAKEV